MTVLEAMDRAQSLQIFDRRNGRVLLFFRPKQIAAAVMAAFDPSVLRIVR